GAAPAGLPVPPTEAEIARRIETLRGSGRRVWVALPLTSFPGEPADYRQETRADSMTAARLASDPGVRVEREDRLPSGFRVVTYGFGPGERVAPGSRAPVARSPERSRRRAAYTRSTNSPVRVSIFTRLPAPM